MDFLAFFITVWVRSDPIVYLGASKVCWMPTEQCQMRGSSSQFAVHI